MHNTEKKREPLYSWEHSGIINLLIIWGWGGKQTSGTRSAFSEILYYSIKVTWHHKWKGKCFLLNENTSELAFVIMYLEFKKACPEVLSVCSPKMITYFSQGYLKIIHHWWLVKQESMTSWSFIILILNEARDTVIMKQKHDNHFLFDIHFLLQSYFSIRQSWLI